MIRISFIVPTFNRAHFIAHSLASIISQMTDADEIIVIDDGSTDSTEDVVRAAGSRIRYVRQDNAGKSVALNRAMQMTGGQFIWICDDDDLLRRGAVELLSREIDDSGAGFVFGRYSRFCVDEQDRVVDLGTGYWPDLSSGTVLRHLLEDAFVLQNATLVRRNLYDCVGPFNETLLRSQDYEMFLRLAIASPGHYVDSLIYDQRRHDGPRGPARVLHAAVDSERVWLDFDRRIFSETVGPFDLALFNAMFEAETPALLQRVALLQRACVNARHDLWSRALDDLEVASQLCLDSDLTAVERAIALRIFSGKYGFAGALELQNTARLRRLMRSNRFAGRLGRAVVAGLLWRVRRGNTHDGRQARILLWRLGGVFQSGRTIMSHIAKQRAQPMCISEPQMSRSGPYYLEPWLTPVSMADGTGPSMLRKGQR